MLSALAYCVTEAAIVAATPTSDSQGLDKVRTGHHTKNDEPPSQNGYGFFFGGTETDAGGATVDC